MSLDFATAFVYVDCERIPAGFEKERKNIMLKDLKPDLEGKTKLIVKYSTLKYHKKRQQSRACMTDDCFDFIRKVATNNIG